jgi:hypothetical protein
VTTQANLFFGIGIAIEFSMSIEANRSLVSSIPIAIPSPIPNLALDGESHLRSYKIIFSVFFTHFVVTRVWLRHSKAEAAFPLLLCLWQRTLECLVFCFVEYQIGYNFRVQNFKLLLNTSFVVQVESRPNPDQGSRLFPMEERDEWPTPSTN